MTVEMFPNENFKPIKGWEGYYISDSGIVISYRNKCGGIADVCNGKYKQAFGLKWCWYDSGIS